MVTLSARSKARSVKQGYNLLVDLFEDLTPAEPSLFPEDREVARNPYSEKYTEDRALYSAIAAEPMSGDEAFELIFARNKELIEQGQEQVISDQLAAGRVQREVQANASIQRDLLFTENSSALISLFEEQRQARAEREQRSAIEKESIRALQDLMVEDPYQASLYVNRVRTGGLIDRQLEHATKLAIFQREYDKLQMEWDEQGIGAKAFDILASIVDAPLASVGEFLNLEDEAVETGDRRFFTRPSDKIKRQEASLFDPNVSLDEFEDNLTRAVEVVKRNSGVLRDSPLATLGDFQALGGLNNSDALTYDAFVGLDIATLPGAGLAVRAINNPVRFAKSVGNRAAAVRGAVGAITTPSTNARVNAEALRESIPNSLVPDLPGFVDPTIGLSGDVAKRLDVIARARAEAFAVPNIERLEKGQYAEAIRKKVEERVKDFEGYNIVDIKQTGKAEEVVTDPDTGVRFFNLYIGRKSGEGGYLTENAAKGARARMGLPDETEIYHGVDDRYYIKVRTDVPETGITKPVLKTDELGNTGRIGAWIKNPANSIADVLAQKLAVTEGIQSRLHGAVVKPLLKDIKALSKREQKDLEAILSLGEQEQKRFTQEELASHFEKTLGRLPSDKEINAYYSLQELQDFSWAMLDRNVYVDKVRRGFETVRVFDNGAFDTAKRNGRVVSPDATRSNRVYDLEDQRGYAAGSNETKFKEKLDSGNYIVVQLEGEYDFADEPIKYILAHKRSVERGPLKRTQLGYVPGGQRIYTNKFFVKQARSFEFKDGSKAWSNPLTHFTVATEKEAAEVAAKWENARQAYVAAVKGDIDIADADIIISENTYLDYAAFDTKVKKGVIDAKHPFEALYDRTRPTAMSGVGDTNLWVDEAGDSVTEYYTTKGRLYYSKKNEEALLNPDEERAEVLSPFKAIEKSVNYAINTRSMADYTIFAVEEWARLASPAIRRGQFAEQPDPYRLFLDGQLDKDFVLNNPRQAETLEANRDVIKRFMGIQTEQMSVKEKAIRNFANWIDSGEKTPVGQTRRYIARRAMDIMDSNPANAVNAAVFHSQFGFYDPGQLFLQTQTATAALAIHPVWGAQAAAMYPFLRLVTSNLNEGVLDYVAKRSGKITGMADDEFKTMVRTMIRSGEYDIGGSALQHGRFHQAIGGSGVIESAASVVGKGRVFFDEAERINRTVAWQIAWREVRQRSPELAMDSEEFIRAVKIRANDFGQNMRNVNAAEWQKGVLAPATRFMSYQARLLENMLPKVFGGNPRFSAAQKMKLAAGQLVLFGTAGLPFMDYVANQWKEQRKEEFNPDAWRLFTKGLYDNLFYYASGGELDTDFSARAGTGAGWAETISGLIDGTNNSVLEVAGGPALSIGGDSVGSLNRIVEYAKAGLTGEDFNAESFRLIMGDLANNINSLERYNKAATIWRYGKIRDKVTGQPIVDATELEGWAALLGIPLTEEREIFEQYKAVSNRQDEIDNNAKLLVKFNNSYFDAMAVGDEKRMQEALRLKAAFMAQFADDPLMRDQVARRAISIDSRTLDKATYAREQYEKILGVRPQPKQEE